MMIQNFDVCPKMRSNLPWEIFNPFPFLLQAHVDIVPRRRDVLWVIEPTLTVDDGVGCEIEAVRDIIVFMFVPLASLLSLL